MRAVVQRVSEARVTVDGEVVGDVGRGLLVLLCAMEGDRDADLDWVLRKVIALRVFPDADGRMNEALTALPAVTDAGPSGLLVVSQFTLSADLSPKTAKGNRPAFTQAMAPGAASVTVDAFVDRARAALSATGHRVATGVFGADMKVSLVNDGPVTLCLDSCDRAAGHSGETR